MISNIFYFSLIISILFLILIYQLIRKKRLKEQYALLWIGLSVLMIFLSMFPAILEAIARVMNVSYPPALLYLLGFIGILLILLHLTVVVSKLTERNIKLTQLSAIHKQQLEQLRKKVESQP